MTPTDFLSAVAETDRSLGWAGYLSFQSIREDSTDG